MVRLEKLSPEERKGIESLVCPIFKKHPFVDGPTLNKRRVAIISTAGLHRREDRPFTHEAGDFYRIIPGDIKSSDLVMSHVSVNFDRTGFQQDWNVVFPIDRLRELILDKFIGSMASYHYSFMGADDPMTWETQARRLATILKKDGVNAVVLLPV